MPCAPVRSRSPIREPISRLPCHPCTGSRCPYDPREEQQGDWQLDAGGAARVGELDCYVSGVPRAAGAGVLVLADDVWGLNGALVRGACDELAAVGYLVVAPDFRRPLLSNSGFGELDEPARCRAWLRSFKKAQKSKALDLVLRFLKRAGVGRVGCVGLSSGAWAAAHLSRDPGLVQAGIWCYPSRLGGSEISVGETEAGLAAAVRAPTLILPSRDSPELYADGELASVMRSNGVETEVVYFKGASVEWLAEQADGWFSRHLSSKGSWTVA
mmetsp:Transcript_29675/g.92258  ORF Transcript_29675/g.92258 Transcript_29675/m.92258 type:complete len:271 (-) Transcript_29675:43-855(-)